MGENILRLNVKGCLLAFLVILFGVGIAFYRYSLYGLFIAVVHREGSSHGVFVPFLAGYLLWLKSDFIKEIKPQPALMSGVMMLLGGVVLLFLSKFGFALPLSILSFLCIAGAFVLIFFGTEIFREMAFPLFFLATMIPLPTAVYNQIAHWMRIMNTWGSVIVTKALGVPVYREEFNIYLPGINLFVADSCSGIRYLVSYFVFSLVYAALFRQGMIARLLVILSSIPLAIFAGIARLSVIFLAAHYINPVMAEPRPHIILSWAVFAVFLFGVIGVDQYLMRRKAKGERRRFRV